MGPAGPPSVHPSQFGFSVDGDLVGRDLAWQNWGSSTATATGSFDFSPPPKHRTTTVGGTFTVSGLKPCNGTSYYTAGELSFDQTPPFQPTVFLSTPCD